MGRVGKRLVALSKISGTSCGDRVRSVIITTVMGSVMDIKVLLGGRSQGLVRPHGDPKIAIRQAGSGPCNRYITALGIVP